MRVSQQPAYVLHHYSYGETSLLLEVFTRAYGRLGLLAKGVRRARVRQRTPLECFQPLFIGWSGRGELPVLSGVEPADDTIFLSGVGLYCGFYMNELLLRLLHRHDPHESLFDTYQSSLKALQLDKGPERTLRIFEKRLLQEVGYGLVLNNEIDDNAPIQSDAIYEYIVNRGPVRVAETGVQGPKRGVRIQGSSLLALARESLNDVTALRETKILMRVVLDEYLGGKPLNSRKLFRDLQQAPVVGTD